MNGSDHIVKLDVLYHEHDEVDGLCSDISEGECPNSPQVTLTVMLALRSAVTSDASIAGKPDSVDYHFFDVCEVGRLGQRCQS
jgi:hypothetical protein